MMTALRITDILTNEQVSYILIVSLALVLALGLYMLIRHFSKPRCALCSRPMTCVERLDLREQTEILNYFQKYEGRSPNTAETCVCEDCRRVVDDMVQPDTTGWSPYACKLCGGALVELEGMHLTPDERREFLTRYPELFHEDGSARYHVPGGGQDWKDPYDAEPQEAPFGGCRACYTVHAWLRVPESKYEYFVPVADEQTFGILLAKLDAQREPPDQRAP